MSTADACVFGAAPNAVDAPEKILDAVESCVCVSSPITTSQVMRSLRFQRTWGTSERRRAAPRRSLRPRGGQRARTFSERGGPFMPIGRLLVSVRDVEDPRLVEVVALDMKPDRQSAAIEAAWNRDCRRARQVR